MIKKLITFFILYFIVFLWNAFSASIPVEQVFSDISKDYKYYNELQTLYDKGMIKPDSEWKFNPKKLLNRDEFVWIMMEVSCKKCISPNVWYDFIQKYSDSTLFFDINKTNKYFYCIAWADSSWFVKWYDPGTKCEDGTSLSWEKPFCPNNTIILEEALAVILRASGILTNSEADSIRIQIASWQITKNLADDVTPKNLDWSVYSFYPDFQRALDYELVEYDKYWNEKIYRLIEVVNGKIRPKQAITKEEFLRIAYISLKSNSCNEKKEDKLGLEMNILNKSCTEKNVENCSDSNLTWNEKVFDFYWNVSLPLWDSVNKNTWYIWRFYNYNTGEEIKKYGSYIDNYDFLKDWDYRVFLRVISDKWNTSEVYNDLSISNTTTDENNNKLSIDVKPIFWVSPLLVNFSSIFSWNSNWNSYFWDFWDGTTSLGKTTNHIYKEPWVYKTTLNVKDNDWYIYSSTVTINVLDKSYIDTDKDGVADKDDYEIETPSDKILYICTKNDIDKKRFNCDSKEKLWVYSEMKKSIDTDGDWYIDTQDYEILTPSSKILYVCTEEDIANKRYICKTKETLWVYSKEKENDLIWDYDDDWFNDLEDACPEVEWIVENKWCPVFDKFCSVDTDCYDWYYCNSGICSPKQVSTNCEYTGWDLITWNVICNSCPCSNFVDFNSSIRKCDKVFPAIVSPDKKTIYSKWNYYEIK